MEQFNFQEMENDLLRPISIDLDGNKLVYKYSADGSATNRDLNSTSSNSNANSGSSSRNSSSSSNSSKNNNSSNSSSSSSSSNSDSISSSCSNSGKSGGRINIRSPSLNKWETDGSDIERVTVMIEALTSELKRAIDENNSLRSALSEVNDTNSVILEMLINERQKNCELEQDKVAYKEELTIALKTIIHLKKKKKKQEIDK
jgi:hypothetical protein